MRVPGSSVCVLSRPGYYFMVLTMAFLLFADPIVSLAQVRSNHRARRISADPVSPEIHASALSKLGDCADLQLYLGEVMLETVVSYRYGWNRWSWANPWSQPGGETDNGPGDYTTTNNQEAGVDELDIVKTNGNFVFSVHEDELIVVRSWPAESSEVAARVDLGGWGRGLLLHDNLVAVLTINWRSGAEFPRHNVATGLQIFDVSNPAAPQLIRVLEIEGQPAGARLIAGQLYLVIMSYMSLPEEIWDLVWANDLGLPEIDWYASEEEYNEAAAIAREILRPLIYEIALNLEPEDLLPLMTDSAETSSDPELLFECSEIYQPAEPSEYSVLDVLHLDLNGENGGLGELGGAGVIADGWVMYASTNNLYIAQSSRWRWWGFDNPEMTTAVHAFELGSDPEIPVRYAATGEVPGWLQSQFAMSEHDGHLRIATTMFDWWWGFNSDEEDSGGVISVLKDNQNGILENVGQLRNIAPGEQIVTSRMMGEVGYLVTFERVDPLFTLDLSDPTDPRVVGELEMPGFSAYLHPVDENHLLAVGMAGEEDGTITGLAINIFDVSDASTPLLKHQYIVEDENTEWSWSEALRDHHAFTFHRDVLSIPAYIWGDEEIFSGLLVFSIDLEGGISMTGQVDHHSLPEDPDVYRGNTSMRRSIYIEDNLFSLSARGIKVNDLNEPSNLITEVPFF